MLNLRHPRHEPVRPTVINVPIASLHTRLCAHCGRPTPVTMPWMIRPVCPECVKAEAVAVRENASVPLAK